MSSWITDYMAAWNSHDGAQVAAFLSEDVVYEDVALGAVMQGRAAVESFVHQGAERFSSFEFTVVSEQVSGDSYAFEWTLTGMGGPEVDDDADPIRGASVGRLDTNGLISENRDYWRPS